MTRPIDHRYSDPLDQIWITTAARIGLKVRRSDAVYASTDPDKTLHVGNPQHLDADDSLAQMIFHELCHSLVEGHDAFERPDWGLDNTSDRDVDREYACLRVQATLAASYGLRDFLAPTTEHREFFDGLAGDALQPAYEPSVLAARVGVYRADRHPWGPHLRNALQATADIARRARQFASDPTSLWHVVGDALPVHPVGFHQTAVDADTRRCSNCAWLHPYGPDDADYCRQAGKPTQADAIACERWEPPPDCLHCGACCRAAYHSVTILPTEPIITKHPDMVVDRDDYVELRRAGDRCAALCGGSVIDGVLDEPFTCRVYDDRPRNCREFENSGEHCLTARRRVGLSR